MQCPRHSKIHQWHKIVYQNKARKKKFDPLLLRVDPSVVKFEEVSHEKYGFGKVGRPKKGTKPKKPPRPIPLEKRVNKKRQYTKTPRMTRNFFQDILLNKVDPPLLTPKQEPLTNFNDYEDPASSPADSPADSFQRSIMSIQSTEDDNFDSPSHSPSPIPSGLKISADVQPYKPTPVSTEAESSTESTESEIQVLKRQLEELKATVGNFRCSQAKTWQEYIKSIPVKRRTGPEFNFQEEWKEFQPLYNKSRQPPSRVLTEDGFKPVTFLWTVMEFRPTLDQMDDFEKFVSFMIWMGADIAGGAIIKPPVGYCPRKGGYESWKMTFKNGHVQNTVDCVSQTTQYVSFKQEGREYSVQELFILAMQSSQPPSDKVSEEFWKFLHLRKPIYCKDEEGTLFDEDQTRFNLNKLDSLLKQHGNWLDRKCKGNKGSGHQPGAGLIISYLYLSCFGTVFSDHIEDFSFFSINYLHFGHSKRWRFIPPSFGFKYIQLLRRLHSKLYKEFNSCEFFVLHKQLFTEDSVLKEAFIPYSYVDQEAGDFVVTFPFGFHSGYNTGFNLAEAVNFVVGSDYWPLYGIFTPRCAKVKCEYGDMSTLDIGPLIQNCMPQVYEQWNEKQGFKGRHPSAFKNAPLQTVFKKKREVDIPKYICDDPSKEDMDLSYKFRGFYKDGEEGDLENLRSFDISKEMSAWTTAITKKKKKKL